MIRVRDKGDVPDDPLSRMRHSASHVMADAVRRLRPGAKVAIGPSIETGFYYDFDTAPFSPEDAAKIEAEMAKIIAQDLPFERRVVSREEALRLFGARDETYKVEIIQSLPEGEEISFYQHGDFIDLCRGPHVDRTVRHQGVQGALVRRAPTGAGTSATRCSSGSTGPRSARRRSWTSS